MNKILMWIVSVVAVVALGGGVFYVVTRGDDGSTSNTVAQTGDAVDPGTTKTACDIFTDAVAREVLGEGATKSPTPPGGDTSTNDVSVTQCMYELDDGTDLKIANILVRGAKNEGAYPTNEQGFSDTRDSEGLESESIESEAISGLGDDAYYNPGFEQVNVLVNGGQYWIIVQADGGRAPSEALARAVIANL